MFSVSSLAFCRITLALIGLSWLVMGTILVGILPESRYGWKRASPALFLTPDAPFKDNTVQVSWKSHLFSVIRSV